jgi:hypothetical protein
MENTFEVGDRVAFYVWGERKSGQILEIIKDGSVKSVNDDMMHKNEPMYRDALVIGSGRGCRFERRPVDVHPL